NYSFGHEIGHLLGCRHDPYVDNTQTPFAYGHGYVNPSNTWRTIMAYPDACGSCTRLLYWSNPNVTYGGVPMGTTSTNNNTRVWNEQSNSIMTFRQPENSITFTSSDVPNSQYADVIAKQNITTGGTVNINNGNTLNMRAGNSITLEPGFSVKLGAEFSATIENIHDCGTSSFPAPKIMIQNMPEKYDDMNEIPVKNAPDFSYTAYPSLSGEFINITYSLNAEIPLLIELVNFLGQKIKTILPKQNQQAGIYTLPVSVSDFSTGTYFLTISSTNQTKTEKIIINK
ncbi:MAG: T9SS type A sorting domain-containing protein, partial [Prevotellaceae bacterium]|nr:T9SS type A sorting domain-containing protein [Prevotellaceae bacterium]